MISPVQAIQRCLPRSPYLRTSDDRLLQMAWQKLLFSEQTPYQLVEIYHTLDFGAVLVLDGFTNLAESDLAYTQALMCHGVQVLAGRKEMEKEETPWLQ
jgi:spermidine synthase